MQARVHLVGSMLRQTLFIVLCCLRFHSGADISCDVADISLTTPSWVNKEGIETLLNEGSGENLSDEDDISPNTPSWVNKEFIETVLNKENEGTKLKVESFEAKYACKEGMGYSSYIIRIVATVRLGESTTCEKRNFILKYTKVDEKTEDEPDELEPESVVLAEIIPQVHRLLRGVEGECSQPVSPRCYLSASRPAPLLAIEDLSPAGFRTADGPTPLSYQHCAAVLRAYARLHAASARLLKDQPHYKALLDPKDFMTEDSQEYYVEFAHHLFKAVARMLRAQQGYESYAAKYERLAEKFTNGFFKYWRSGVVRLPVVLHGDCWKYNHMFSYKYENVTGVRLIDFEGSLVHSGAADLVHFLYRNAGVEVHRDHVAPLLADYHGTLVALLRQLGMAEEADNYPLQALLDDVDAAGANALYYSALSLMSLTSHERSAHWGQFFQIAKGSEALLEDAFRNPHYVATLKYLVPVFDKKGLL